MEKIKSYFNTMVDCRNWKMYLVKTNVDGLPFYAEMIKKIDKDGIDSIVKNIINDHISDELNKYISVEKYNDFIDKQHLYKLYTKDVLIKESYKELCNAISNCNCEHNELGNKYDFYILTNSIKKNDIKLDIKMVFMQNPVTILKNKLIRIDDEFVVCKDSVISLKQKIDVIIFNDLVVFFNDNGEKLFNMERTIKTICNKEVEAIIDSGFVTDSDNFIKVANFGFNPRKFLSFDKKRLDLLKNTKLRNTISKKFGIPIINNKFDTSTQESAEGFLKLLCGKGSLDPFDDSAIEVAGAKKWNRSV